MQQELTRRKEKLFKYGLHMQPIMVVIGDLTAPLAAYVVVDDATWKISTSLKAVDVCFKAFHVLHASYPAESHAWLLLQKLVYAMHTKWDTKSSAVSGVLSDLHDN